MWSRDQVVYTFVDDADREIKRDTFADVDRLAHTLCRWDSAE